MKNCADIIIVGSGIIGNAAAYYLAKKGASVIVLEKARIQVMAVRQETAAAYGNPAGTKENFPWPCLA